MGKIPQNPTDPNYNVGADGRNRFAKGNKIGRMKKKGFTLTDLNKVVVAYEKTHDQTILKHYIEQLFKDNRLLDKYIDRNVPTKQELEITIPKTVKEKEFVQKTDTNVPTPKKDPP